MLSLHTNMAALSAQSATSLTQKTLTTTMTRLSTGLRINSAMDDAAGLQIATRLDAQVRGMTVAMRNTQNATSMMQTGEGAFKEMTNLLLRMKDLATQSADASTSVADRTALQGEYDALGAEMANIMKNTTFGGERLFSNGTTVDGTLGKFSAALDYQIGSTSAEKMTVDVSTTLGTLGTGLTGLSASYAGTLAAGTAGTEISTAAAANAKIDAINLQLDNIGAVRAAFGANSNRLDSVYNNLTNMSTQATAAKGRIMDVDYASETANMTKNQLLLQAGTSMLKQSNSMSQLVMSLMQ